MTVRTCFVFCDAKVHNLYSDCKTFAKKKKVKNNLDIDNTFIFLYYTNKVEQLIVIMTLQGNVR